MTSLVRINFLSLVIEILPAHKIKNFRFRIEMCKVLNSTAIASGFAGRDLQGGTSDGSFFIKFFLCYN